LSRNSLHLLEPRGLLLCSQQPATYSLAKPHQKPICHLLHMKMLLTTTNTTQMTQRHYKIHFIMLPMCHNVTNVYAQYSMGD